MRWVYQSWAYLLKPSVFRGFALVILGRSAVNTHHRKAFWSTEFIVNGTCGRTCRNVISYIKSMLVFSYTSWVLNTWRDHPVPGWLHTSHSFIFKVTQRLSFAQPCHFSVVSRMLVCGVKCTLGAMIITCHKVKKCFTFEVINTKNPQVWVIKPRKHTW